MSRIWTRAKRAEFARDVFRDFCLADRALERELARLDSPGETLSFEVLRDLLGEEMNKGLLWRLKDTAHHLFRGDGGSPAGSLLDWGMGYIFHETIKLKEDAYQRRTYGPLFAELDALRLDPEVETVGRELLQVVHQTRESIEREARRIRFILSRCRGLFPPYLAAHRQNPHLARFLFDQEALVREVFGSDFERLVAKVYGDEPQLMHILASQSLRQGGWMDDARRCMRAAALLAPEDPRILQEKRIVDNWTRRLSA